MHCSSLCVHSLTYSGVIDAMEYACYCQWFDYVTKQNPPHLDLIGKHSRGGGGGGGGFSSLVSTLVGGGGGGFPSLVSTLVGGASPHW